jgi:hypothetical protein
VRVGTNPGEKSANDDDPCEDIQNMI